MIHVMLIILMRLGTPAPDCAFLDKAGFIVPAHLQQITDAIGTYHILSAPATARLLQCDGFKPITFRPGVTTYSMQLLKTDRNLPAVNLPPTGE